MSIPPQGLLRRATDTARIYFRAYDANAAEAAQFRARQIQATMALTPIAMVINMLNAAILSAVLWGQASHVLLSLWSLTVFFVAAAGLYSWVQSARRPRRNAASIRGIRRAVGWAAALGVIWALPPALMLPELDAGGRFVVGMVTIGMICAGGFALSSVPGAATTYVLILTSGAAIGLLRGPSDAPIGVSLLLLAYSATVVYAVWVHAKILGARLVAEAQADRQSEVIGLLLRDFEDHASDLLWELDAHGRFAHVSQRLADALALPASRLRRLRASMVLAKAVPASEDAVAHWQRLQELVEKQAPFRDCVVTLNQGQEPQWWSLSARPLFDGAGRFQGWRGVAADITDKQLAHHRLRWMAHYDALTGLVNRSQFHETLGNALEACRHQGRPLAVIAFDVDGFKQVNDNQGHAAGDALLREVGTRLCATARRGYTVARLGGDEFMMLVDDAADEAQVRPLLDRLLDALSEPCTLANGSSLVVRASMGVAFAPVHGEDIDTLMHHADIALYAAKRSGGQQACIFHPALADADRRRSTIEQALRGALARDEFHLVFQPQVGADSWRVGGFEALLRWRHPELGEVSPVEFVPVAERAGLMIEIGRWVLAEACRVAAQWPRGIKVAINISATQLGDGAFVESVQAATQALPPERVELEITESSLIDDPERAVAMLNALRDRGFRIALDDFGTGYSALGYLRRFPFDSLKIDRSFVRDLATQRDTQAIVDSILGMARALRMATIAEGIESTHEAELLRSRGCGSLQGYLISRPLRAEAVLPFLQRWNLRHGLTETRRAAPRFVPSDVVPIEPVPTQV